MKRMQKAILMPLRSLAYRWNRLRLYYWTDAKVYELRTVTVMPAFYYRGLYHACMWLAPFRKFRRLADWAIHTIPYHVRFHVS